MSRAAIVREPIDTQAVLERIKRPEDGAAIVFEGVVRNNTRGRKTLYLDYEAYEEMALKQMEELAVQAVGQFHVRDVAVVHRLGRLEIGETSVLIVVASGHRGAAYEASRWLIDTLKMLKRTKVLVICAHAETAMDLEDALRVRSGILAGMSGQELEALFARHGSQPDFILPGFVWQA